MQERVAQALACVQSVPRFQPKGKQAAGTEGCPSTDMVVMCMLLFGARECARVCALLEWLESRVHAFVRVTQLQACMPCMHALLTSGSSAPTVDMSAALEVLISIDSSKPLAKEDTQRLEDVTLFSAIHKWLIVMMCARDKGPRTPSAYCPDLILTPATSVVVAKAVVLLKMAAATSASTSAEFSAECLKSAHWMASLKAISRPERRDLRGRVALVSCEMGSL
jgi:hypothetical protein